MASFAISLPSLRSLIRSFRSLRSFDCSLTSLPSFVSLMRSFASLLSFTIDLRLTPTVAVMTAPDAEIALIDTDVSWPAYDFEFGVDVALNEVLPDEPGYGSPP